MVIRMILSFFFFFFSRAGGVIGSCGLTSCYHRLGTAGHPAGQAPEVSPGESFANLSRPVSTNEFI